MEVFLEDIYEKEYELLCMKYEYAEQNIIGSMFLEAAEGGEGIIATVKRKIGEVIQKIKDFFTEIKLRKEYKEIDEKLSSSVWNSKHMIEIKVNNTEVAKNMKSLLSAYEKSLQEIRDLYGQYKKGRMDEETYNKKCDEVISRLTSTAKKLNTKNTKIITKTSSKMDAISMNEASKKLRETLSQYQAAIGQMQSSATSAMTDLQNAVDDGKHANGALSGSSKVSKVARVAIPAIIAIAGIHMIDNQVRGVSQKDKEIDTDLRNKLSDIEKENHEAIDDITSRDLMHMPKKELDKYLKNIEKAGDDRLENIRRASAEADDKKFANHHPILAGIGKKTKKK